MKGTGTNRGVHGEQPREGWAGPAGGGLWLVERQGTEEERRDESRRGRHECLRHVDQPSASKNVETPGARTRAGVCWMREEEGRDESRPGRQECPRHGLASSL